MKFKKNVFPIINVLPNKYDTAEETWDSVGDSIKSKIPMNDDGEFEGVLQTFSNGKLMQERQYFNGRAIGASVFYDIYERPLTVRIVTEETNFAKFSFR